MEDVSQRKILSALSHGSIFFSAFIIPVIVPLIILFTTENSVVKANAKEAINFYINMFIYGIVSGVLCLVLIGFVLLGLLGIISLIMPIIAIIRIADNPNQPYRYPLIFRLF
jgi:hypothetical protein